MTWTTFICSSNLAHVTQNICNLYSVHTPQILLNWSSYRNCYNSKPTSQHLLIEKFVIVAFYSGFMMNTVFVCCCCPCYCFVPVSHLHMSSTILFIISSLYFSFAISNACLFIFSVITQIQYYSLASLFIKRSSVCSHTQRHTMIYDYWEIKQFLKRNNLY